MTRPGERALYDSIGQGYQTTRRADPGICEALWQHLAGLPTGRYLDIGCGTGTYTGALAARGGTWTGVDVSETMLQKARSVYTGVFWQPAAADHLPFPDNAFDGAIATLCIHHFPDLERPFLEARRVLRAGRFVIFTDFPEQMQNYWLRHYFPGMIERAANAMPSEATLRDALREAGFAKVQVTPFRVTAQLQDLFLYAGKERPELYLNPAMRANISSFRLLCDEAELTCGLRALESDLLSGAFPNVARQYETTNGDYAFVVAEVGTSP